MAIYNQVETGMSLIGATAVEDRWVLNQHAELTQLNCIKHQIFMPFNDFLYTF